VTLQVVLERDGVVVLLVFGAVEERDWSAVGRIEERLPGLVVPIQLLEVPLAKLAPLLRVVTKPLAELGAWSHVP
jgi:hypothetical protein